MKHKGEKTAILLADDHLVVRMGIGSIISYEPDMVVVGEAESGTEAVSLATELQPDVIIMDLMMPKLNGVDATIEILRRDPGAKVLILTSFGSSPDIVRAIKAGARGALLKSSSREELIDAIRRIQAGQQTICTEIANTLESSKMLPELSARQLEVLNLAAKGFSNGDIGKILGISANSVKDHLRLIFSRLGVATRTEATTFAIIHGWISG